MSASILIVEDEEPLKVLLAYNFEAEGYRVRSTAMGEDVAMLIADERPNLVILDWMLPGISGIEVCRLLRSRADTRNIPIIMLTARGEESERVRGLATGADDYVVKPFSVPELLARVRSLLRRADPDVVAEVLSIGDLSLDRKMRRVTRAGRDIILSPTEFRLLEHLMQSPGRVYSRAQLLDAVWGRDVYIDERTVDVHVGRLRRALSRVRESDPIRTVRGTGYSFNERFEGELAKGPGERRHTPVRGADR
jgi:two-component system phosphate regulon response regulator PhoB